MDMSMVGPVEENNGRQQQPLQETLHPSQETLQPSQEIFRKRHFKQRIYKSIGTKKTRARSRGYIHEE